MSPETLALLLGLGSAITLAFANAFVKAGGDILMSRAATSLSGAVMMIPAAIIFPLPTAETWTMLALSVPSHMLYQTFLIRALHRGDLSLVFPVMRGSAPMLTALGAWLVLSESLPPMAIAGLVLASLATIIFALPERHLGGDSRTRNIALMWALATGAGVALYNIVDARGVRSAPEAMTFIAWMFILDSPGVNIAAIWSRKGQYLPLLRSKMRYGVTAGALSVLSFSMALYGFRIAPVSFISALRETAVVFAAILGVVILKEGFGARRILAAAALATGLILFRMAS